MIEWEPTQRCVTPDVASPIAIAFPKSNRVLRTRNEPDPQTPRPIRAGGHLWHFLSMYTPSTNDFGHRRRHNDDLDESLLAIAGLLVLTIGLPLYLVRQNSDANFSR